MNTTDGQENKLYENEQFQNQTDDILRPGGLEMTEELVGLANLPTGATLLDVGCGCGRSVAYLSGQYQVSGIDCSASLVAKGQQRQQGLDLAVGDAACLPREYGSLDGLLLECVLSLVPDRPVALAEFSRVLKADGKLLTSDLYLRQGEKNFAGLPLVTCINGIRTEGDIRAEMAAAGFSCLEWVDKTAIYKGFLAGLIMRYGSMAAFWQSLVGDCDQVCRIQDQLRGVKIGYYLAVWGKRG